VYAAAPPAFLAEPSPTPALTSLPADKSADTMRRLRHPFEIRPREQDDNTEAGQAE